MKCMFCDKEILPGQRAYEFTTGITKGIVEYVPTRSLGFWCEPCEAARRILSLKSGEWRKDKYWTKEEKIT